MIGMRDRGTGEGTAESLVDTRKLTMQGSNGPHQVVQYLDRQLVNGVAQTESMESFWAILITSAMRHTTTSTPSTCR